MKKGGDTKVTMIKTRTSGRNVTKFTIPITMAIRVDETSRLFFFGQPRHPF